MKCNAQSEGRNRRYGTSLGPLSPQQLSFHVVSLDHYEQPLYSVTYKPDAAQNREMRRGGKNFCYLRINFNPWVYSWPEAQQWDKTISHPPPELYSTTLTLHISSTRPSFYSPSDPHSFLTSSLNRIPQIPESFSYSSLSSTFSLEPQFPPQVINVQPLHIILLRDSESGSVH